MLRASFQSILCRTLGGIAAVVLLPGGSGVGRAADVPGPDIEGFQKHVEPFFNQYCLKCHGATKPEAGLSLGKLNADLTSGKNLGKWRSVLERLRRGEMPPAEEPRPPAESVVHVTRAKQPAELPAEERAGILTQPSWLAAYSTNFDNHAILRGKWVRERLLGGSVPDLPITVDAKLPDDPNKTLRERMVVTRQDYCWNCHRRMNDLGLGFEMYDHFGRFRTKELNKPVDATGLVAGSGDAKLDGPVSDALVLIRKLAASERVEQVFVRHAFRYWMGRNETPDDAYTLQQAHKAYKASGGSMKALVASLLTSEAFLYRWAKSP